MGGVADDDGLFRFNTQSVAEGEYHVGRGFGRIFAGAGGFQPKGLGVGLCDGFVQAASAFAGGDGKPIALLFQALQAGRGLRGNRVMLRLLGLR